MNPRHCHKARFVLLPLFVVVVLALLTFVVRGLWNGVLTEVTAVKPVTYWQALGLLVLAKILFGGFPGRGRHCGPMWRGGPMEEGCALPAGAREKMRDEMRRRFGSWPRPCGSREEPAPGDAPPKA